MAVSLNELAKELAVLGFLNPTDLKAVWESVPSAERPKDAESLAKLLTASGKLSEFQSAQLLAGNGKSLVMGEYVLLNEIGAGGMGNVYRARHRRMDRVVALKVMAASSVKDEQHVKRFQREVQAAARLSHPNIVTAYDAGETDKQHYLVMQYVDGGDLNQLVQRQGPLPVERALNFTIQAARGLEYAHTEGVVHRDIKPANLLVDKKGVVRILDMGLARLDDGSEGLTSTEQVMGTVDYMSPEQASSSTNIDARTDIYALGCSLWYLLTGRKVYEGETVIRRIMAHREAELPSLTDIRDDAPWPVEQALHKMLAKRPQDRFQSMAEVITTLEQCRSQSSSAAMGSSVLNDKDFASFIHGMSTTASPGSSASGSRGPASRLNPGSTSKVNPKSGSKVATKSKTPSSDTAEVVQADAGTKVPPAKLPRGKPMGFPSAESAQEAAAQVEPATEEVVEEVEPAGSRLPIRWIAAGIVGSAVRRAALVMILRRDDSPAGETPPAGPRVMPGFARAPFDAATAQSLQEQWAGYLKLPLEHVNTVGLKMRLVPPGEFQMGSTEDEIGTAMRQVNNPSPDAAEKIRSEGPRHRVVITTPLYVGATEVTLVQFRKFAEASRYITDKEQENLDRKQNNSTWQNPAQPSTDNSPVTEISWSDAVAFCNWLSEKEQLKKAYINDLTQGWVLVGGDGYRLPSEAQWEYACRAGTTTQFSCGDDLLQLRDAAWFNAVNTNKNEPVGSKKPNPFGLFDMHGGVQEWCHDAYRSNWYSMSLTPNPEAPGNDGRRIVRGGHRMSPPVELRSAKRNHESRNYRNNTNGFRIVRSFDQLGLMAPDPEPETSAATGN